MTNYKLVAELLSAISDATGARVYFRAYNDDTAAFSTNNSGYHNVYELLEILNLQQFEGDFENKTPYFDDKTMELFIELIQAKGMVSSYGVQKALLTADALGFDKSYMLRMIA